MSGSNDGAGKKASKKLKLNKTTLKRLSDENLKGVAGGDLTGDDCYSGLVPCDAYSRRECTHAAPFCN